MKLNMEVCSNKNKPLFETNYIINNYFEGDFKKLLRIVIKEEKSFLV